MVKKWGRQRYGKKLFMNVVSYKMATSFSDKSLFNPFSKSGKNHTNTNTLQVLVKL